MIRPVALAFVIISALLWGYVMGYRDSASTVTDCIEMHYA